MPIRSQRHLMERDGRSGGGPPPELPLSNIRPDIVQAPAFGGPERLVAQLTVEGGREPFTWTLPDNGGLMLHIPPDTSTLLVSGDTVGPLGSFTITVSVKDDLNQTLTDTMIVEVI